jgi:hypothetical protein
VEFTVATDAREQYYEAAQRHAVAAAPGGSFVVTWQTYVSDDIVAQRYDAAGLPIGGSLLVSAYGNYPDMAVAGNGDFVVVWHDADDNVMGRHFSAASAAFGSAFQVNAGPTYGVQQRGAAVATTPDGFVVAWAGDGAGAGYDPGVFARRFAVPNDGTGISGEKLVVVDKLAASGKAKTVYVSKLDPGIVKGAAGDPALLSGSFEVFYTDAPANVSGSFALPAPWQKNEATVAKYVNTLAPAAPGHVKVAVVKDGLLAKVAAKGLGDGPTLDLSFGPPSASGGVTTVLTLTNGSDATVRRFCTRFATDDGSTVEHQSIAGGTGYKLVARGGVATSCP